jgi:hypothetical protein
MIKRQTKKTYPLKHIPIPQPSIPTGELRSIPFKIILEDRVINRDGSVVFFKKYKIDLKE